MQSSVDWHRKVWISVSFEWVHVSVPCTSWSRSEFDVWHPTERATSLSHKLAKSKTRGLHSVLSSLLNFSGISTIFLRGLCSLDVTLLGGRHICWPFPGWAQVSSFCWPWIPAKLNSKFLGHANSAVTPANKSEPSGEIQVYLVCAEDRPAWIQCFRAPCTVNKQNQEMETPQKIDNKRTTRKPASCADADYDHADYDS